MEDQDTSAAAEQNDTQETEVENTGTGTQDTEATSTSDADKFRKIAEDQRKRAEKAEAELKKLRPAQEQKPAPKEEASSQQSDDVVRARLEARGILDEDKQDIVIEAAKVLNTTPVKALDNEIVKGHLAAYDAQKATAAATPAPSRGGGTTTNIARLADKARETGELPTDPKTKALVKEELRRRG
jgi:hypothetical protein